MSTNGNISQLFMITYIIDPVAPAVEALFYPKYHTFTFYIVIEKQQLLLWVFIPFSLEENKLKCTLVNI